MIRGEKVCLRPLRRSDLDFLHTYANDPEFEGEYNNFGLKRDRHLLAAFEEDGLLNARFGNLVVTTSDDQFLGTVSYHPQRYGPEASTAYNIGISLAPEQRGKGYGSEAQKLLADYLFKTYPIMRVEATTDITNIAEQRTLEKAGFTREGVLRKAQWRSGDWHDMVLYSKIRGE
ncbi:GNAT family N-acetyltransferase [Dictyobacter aurantiacus]|uniref:Alanine acetyltransferase n=1 Tax=Dictyobacter aurantiacus TaxID=1936993 RepID=A0A401ZS10_9CHLR|nr:GNAT family protein [Dictyobacter aurantiacus]GCE09633.1 alanine acetyltransferase [Dictyobacter aurantiacus]